MFFDPWTELFKWKPKKYIGGLGKQKNLSGADSDEGSESEASSKHGKKKKSSFWGDTEYGIGWLPLGGYCKISGMIDESMDKEQMQQPPKEWEFRTKPAWQRLLIMIAGVLFNFLLAIVIYAGIVYATGERYVTFKNAEMGMAYSGEAHKIGFRDGDIPLFADGEELLVPGEA
ncbi:MAG: site-2 protease family protein, partial [Muribaculaceae bacterium]|nr:site-2 protease family protein [Muribaculaceae bacterium]